MATPALKDLLLAERLEPARAAELLAPFGLKDPAKADANLQEAAGDPGERLLLAEILDDLLPCVAASADPDQALTRFDRFAASTNRSHLFTYLRNSKQAIEVLAKVLGGSAYMAEILIRDPHHFYWVSDPDIIGRARTCSMIRGDLLPTLATLKDDAVRQLDFLRAAKRREILHIGVRDLLRIASVESTNFALSGLAEALISLTCEISADAETLNGFTVLAMGKLGGSELNFSSDVDLMFVFDSSADPEACRRLAQKVSRSLSAFSGEGYLYRVDLRLRPEGEAGHIAASLDRYEQYYRNRANAWERLSLLKVWQVAGSQALGEQFLKVCRELIFEPKFDQRAIDEVRRLKSQIDSKISARGQTDRDVKLGRGGIREVELVVQILQAKNGLGQRSTIPALTEVHDRQLISREDFDQLREAYLFLRDVENKLQMVDDLQTHSLPEDHAALTVCARLLGYPTADPLLQDLQRHTQNVNRIFVGVLGTGH